MSFSNFKERENSQSKEKSLSREEKKEESTRQEVSAARQASSFLFKRTRYAFTSFLNLISTFKEVLKFFKTSPF